MRLLLSMLIVVAVVLMAPGCAFVSVVGDGNVVDTNLFDMSYRAGLSVPKEAAPLVDRVIPKHILERMAFPDEPMPLSDLIPTPKPEPEPTTRPRAIKPPE